MGEIVEFSRNMQKLLLKKEREYGQLKFLSSRALPETSCFIDELIQAIADISQIIQISSKEGDTITPIAAQWYNYLLLNTNFTSQHLLTEDLLYGHMVGLWPALSPYLFIQIIWHLNCEFMLVESLGHIPLDLCVEILEVAIKGINELETERAMRLIFPLIYKVYDKCLWLHLGTLSKQDVMECACQLTACFQALLDLLDSPKFACPFELSEQARYKQHGIFLKHILRNIKLCMQKKTGLARVEGHPAKLFTLTYGNPGGRPIYHHALPADKTKSIITTLDRELANLLLNQIKRVDCYEYMGWAEEDDDENIMISLQRAIIIELHYFLKFMKQDAFMIKNGHLHDCLQQLLGSSEQSILTLQELCHGIANGRPEGMRELMKRYREWDQSTLNFINQRTRLLKKDDSCVLLEYLHHMFAYPHTKLKRYQAYMSVLRVLVQQSVPNMYCTIQKYVLRHFDDSRLAYLYNEKLFESFMARNLNMRDPQTLRILLVFILLHPRNVLTILVKIAIGHPDYENIVFTPYNMLLLRSFLCANKNDQYNILICILKDISLQDFAWNCKQFILFMNVMLDNQVINSDDLINNVYIPYLIDGSFHYFNFVSVLIHMYDILKIRGCTRKTNYALLIIMLTKKVSMIRKCDPTCLRSIVHDIVSHTGRILSYLLSIPNLLSANQRRAVIDATSDCVEPIDRAQLAPLWQTNIGNAFDIIRDYERRCFFIHRRLRTNSRCEPILRVYAQSFQLDREAFIRHMILHSTEKEYETFMLELTLVFWCHFGWTNEMEAYENIMRITGEAARLSLVFKETFSVDTFISLLRTVVQYCDVFTHMNVLANREKICHILLTFLSSLKEPANRTYLGQMYSQLVARITDIRYNKVYAKSYFNEIREWIEVYLIRCDRLMSPPRDNESSDDETTSTCTACQNHTNSELDMFEAYRFVSECIKISNMEIHHCIEWIRDVIFPKE